MSSTTVTYGRVRGGSGLSGGALAYNGAFWVPASAFPSGSPGTALQNWTEGQTIQISVPSPSSGGGSGGSGTLTASFTMPAVGSTVTPVDVSDGTLFAQGNGVTITVGGAPSFMTVTLVSGNVLTLLNNGGPTNVAPLSTVPGGSVIAVSSTNAPIGASAPGEGQALVLSSGEYEPMGVHTVLNVKKFGAKGDGLTDDTAAIQAALNAFAALCSTPDAVQNGAAPELFFPAGQYLISSMLTLTGVYGGVIRGAGSGCTTIFEYGAPTLANPSGSFPHPLLGQPAMLRRINCQKNHIDGFLFYAAQTHMVVSGAVSAGTSTITISASFGQFAQLAVGMRVALWQGAGSGVAAGGASEILTVASINSGAGTITFSAPCILNYVTTGGASVHLACGVYSCLDEHSDATLPSWAHGASGANTASDCIFGNTNGNLGALLGAATTCNGGGPVRITSNIVGGSSTTCTVEDAGQLANLPSGASCYILDNYFTQNDFFTIASVNITTNTVTFGTKPALSHSSTLNAMVFVQSDANNDRHRYDNCLGNSVVGAFGIEGLNSLQNSYPKSESSQNYCSFYAPRGGSANLTDFKHGSVAWCLVVGGYMAHPYVMIGGYSEDAAGLLYVDPSFNSESVDVRVEGFELKGVPASVITATATRLIKIRVSDSQLALSANCSMSVTDSSGTGNGAFVSFDGTTTSGIASITLSGVRMRDDSFYPAGAPSTSLSSGADITGRPVYGTGISLGVQVGIGLTTYNTVSGVITSGNNDALPWGGYSGIGATKVDVGFGAGSPGAFAIRGILGGVAGQVLDLYFLYLQEQCTISNLASGLAQSGQRIQTPTGADIVLSAPGATGFDIVRLVYDATADGGHGGWLVANVVGTISGGSFI